MPNLATMEYTSKDYSNSLLGHMSFLDILLPGLLPGLSNLAAPAEQQPEPVPGPVNPRRQNRDELAAGSRQIPAGRMTIARSQLEPWDADNGNVRCQKS